MPVELFAFTFVGPELILLGIAVLVAAQLVCTAGEHSGGDLMHTLLSVAGWVFVATGALGVVGSVALMFGIGGIPVGIVTIGVAVVVAAEALVRRRRSQRYALLWTMTVAAERSIPLAPAVRAFAGERRGLFARRADRLADMLVCGVPLPDALVRLGHLLPRNSLPMIGVGYQSGALGAALRRAASARGLQSSSWQSLAGKIIYLCCLVWFGAGMVSYMMWKIVPRYKMIFGEFGAQLPALTELVFRASAWLVDSGCLFLLFPALSILFVYVLLRYTGLIDWALPGTGWVTRRLDTAVILDALSLATRRQQPMPQTLDTLARFYPKASIRGKLSSAARDVAEGNPWCESLYRQRLIKRADLAVLQAAERVGNLAWALEEMADSSRRRLAYRLQAAVQLIYPPVVLLVGAMVMFFVVAMFLPLITLVQRLI